MELFKLVFFDFCNPALVRIDRQEIYKCLSIIIPNSKPKKQPFSKIKTVK